ncbi:heavy metal-responsive transcriptional regulator [Dyella caseinilytica]|uniref:Heavy metal-responsive transcriptional regulator n=1 Tax=Dyella caseinilytica TaxID=1849581 RepID=A0ABX7GNT6_9GAMM|nr:heavy metal-responsive transcriptional regulator [Dyella caseinilytica]QRN52090.1 heavy metal-responsive transcriptional regulator [Dyella caseinilytica]GGA15484.1 Cu(I)-responsive transcriptional regulator [Dyella caseinilytica]
MNSQPASLTIGTVAKRAGVAIDTIRYYEREGLLPEPLRRASGYRSYNESAISRLRFIRRAKDLGFTLDEIRDLLALSADRHRGVKEVKQRAEQRLASIDARIAELMRIRKGLEQLIEACPGHGHPEQCPILRALSDEEVQA